MLPRASGVLLPIPCLPSRFGIGDLGPGSYRFADYLHSAGQRVWQILPLNPTTPAYQYSPYHGAATFACNPLLISPEHLAAEGLLDQDDIPPPVLPEDRIDYAAVARVKQRMLDKACARFKQRLPGEDYVRFCAENAAWLDEYALFAALNARFPDTAWNRWPGEFQQRQPEALTQLQAERRDSIEDLKIVQYFFSRQWIGFKTYCHGKGIRIFGDCPSMCRSTARMCGPSRIFLSWTKPVAPWRCPAFHRITSAPTASFGATRSTDGTLTAKPVMSGGSDGSPATWRCSTTFESTISGGWLPTGRFPLTQPTAVNGRWVRTLAGGFFSELRHRFVCLPVIAEDLGVITADVREIMQVSTSPAWPG